LEEPPRHAIFILATTEKHKLLPTILSRCQIYDFNRIKINDMVEYLEYVAQQEHVEVEPEALNVIAQKADGGMRDALSIFDQVISFSQGKVTYQSVIENLNVLDYEYYFSLTESILEGNVGASILLLDEILNKGFEGQQIVTGLASFFRDLLVCKDPQTVVLFEVGEAVQKKYVNLAQRCPTPLLYKAIEWTNECDLQYRVSRNKRLLIELLLIRLCQLNSPSAPEDDKKKMTIEPIAGESSQTPTPAATQSATVSSPAPAQAAPSNTNHTTAKPEVSLPAGKKPVSISLKKHLTENAEPAAIHSPSENIKEIVNNEPVNQEDLNRFWKEYAQTEDDIHLKNTLLNFSPVLKENNQIEVEVSNPAQAAKLNEKIVVIRRYLAEQLKNSMIQIHIRLNETKTESLPFTDKEKYQYLLAKNSTLGSLVKEFNLRLD
jgi:DNA polymerase-3 subunit gamma/tau